MRFSLVDRVSHLEPGRLIVAEKNLTLAEEYLAEHFPTFPIMPGVLMIEAVTQAGAWLVRVTEDFAHSVILLKEVRNAKFGQFVVPGKKLRLQCEWLKDDPLTTTLKATGEVDGKQSISARLVLERRNLRTTRPDRAEDDDEMVRRFRRLWRDLVPRAEATNSGRPGDRE
jgi:3-hydroxyacyl-[acyl-carrier-protein] dehydratase